MDRLQAMSVLLTVVETGSLSAAGRRLGIPLATVSRKVAELERHLEVRLLNRSSRRIALTDAGRAYAAACRRILEDVEQAERSAAGEYSAPKGDLAITAPIVFGRVHVLPVVVEFLATYPEIAIRLVLADGVANLLEEHLDLAVRIGELPDSSLVASRARRDPPRRLRQPGPTSPSAACRPPGGPRRPRLHHLRGADRAAQLDLHERPRRGRGRDPLAADRQHRRGGDRCRDRRRRHHARALVPGRGRDARRRASRSRSRRSSRRPGRSAWSTPAGGCCR